MPKAEKPIETITKPAGTYRVFHTADWHLGKMLGEHSREEEHRRFLAFLLQAIREQTADLLVIAGDVFDSANPPQTAEAQYFNFLSDLFRQSRCSVVIVSGNHDSPSHLEAPRQVLKALGAHVIGLLPPSPVDTLVLLPDEKCPQLLVAAIPFLRDRDLRTGQSGQNTTTIQQELVEGIRRRYAEVVVAAKPWTDRGIPLLATGHLTVTGSKVSDSEREIHVGGLGAIGADCFPETLDYVALGHLHRPQVASGRENVRYSGSPIPLSFSEASDHKEVRLLDFAGGKLVKQTALSIPLSRQLTQIRAKRESLESALKGFHPLDGELPAWVEVIVEDPVPGENLYDLVQGLVKTLKFEVIRVVGKRTTPLTGMTTAEPSAAEGIDQLLGDPSKVFSHRLEAEPALTPEERAALSILFEELRNLHAEEHREGVVASAPTGQPVGGAA